MKPPSNMPLPWTVSKGYRDGYTLAVIFDKDGNFHEETTPEDREQAAAYIQHCVNNYHAFVEALRFYAKEENWLSTVARLKQGEYRNDPPLASLDAGDKAKEALRKAGEL